MHSINIPPEILARAALAHGGRRHFLDSIDPKRTAHVIVDLQNGFMEPGAPVEVPIARKIVDNVNLISGAVRAAGGLNVFLRFTYDEDEPHDWRAMYQTFNTPARRERMKASFSVGAHYFELWPKLEVAASDLVINKTRFSGLIPGTCALDSILKQRQIETLIITGTLTNCCCESTARDAMQMNYNIIFVADGNAAITDAEHNATLSSMTALFADVMTTEEVMKVVLGKGISGHAAA
jgi:ureidoacrylate peracid hydrolase